MNHNILKFMVTITSKVKKKKSRTYVPKDKSKEQESQIWVETLSCQGPSEGPGVWSNWGERMMKREMRSHRYTSLIPHFAFQRIFSCRVLLWGFPGENFKILDSMRGQLLSAYDIILASPGITNLTVMLTRLQQDSCRPSWDTELLTIYKVWFEIK